MTPEEVSKLTDPEINRLCGEHVMKWALYSRMYGDYWYSERDHETKAEAEDWSPSTSIADAARCMDVVINKRWCFVMHVGDKDLVIRGYKDKDRSVSDFVLFGKCRARLESEAALLAALSLTPAPVLSPEVVETSSHADASPAVRLGLALLPTESS